MLRLDDLWESDLFLFFGFEETGREETEGLTRVFVKPGGFQEFVDIHLWAGPGGGLVRAELLLDRQWIGNEDSVNPFGKDIAKSFIAGLMPQDKDNSVERIILGLWALRGGEDTVVMLGGEQMPPAPDDPRTKAALAVYTGEEGAFDLDSGEARLEMKNLLQEGRDSLLVRISFA